MSPDIWVRGGKKSGLARTLALPRTCTLALVVVLVMATGAWAQVELPVAVTGSNLTVIAGTMVQLDGTQSYDPDGDPIVFWSWRMLSGPPGAQNPLQLVQTAQPLFSATVLGEYWIGLVVSDGEYRSAEAIMRVTVVSNQPPVAVLSATPTNGTVPLTVQFDASGSYDPEGGSLGYGWEFGDGQVAGQPTVTHIYTGPRTFYATLTVVDPLGVTAQATVQITVLPPVPNPPVAVLNASPTSGAVPLTVQFDASQSYDLECAALQYTWFLGDGAIASGAKLTHTYTNAGVYVATLVVTDSRGATDYLTTYIAVGQAPPVVLPVAVAGTNMTVVAGATVQLDGTGSYDPDGDPIVFWSWRMLSGPPGAQNPLQLVQTAQPLFSATVLGEYWIGLVVSDGEYRSAEAIMTVTVVSEQALPPIAVMTATPTTGPAPLTVQVDASGSHDPQGGPLQYRWCAPPCGDAYTTNPVAAYTYTRPGTNSVAVTVLNALGFTDTATLQIIVLPHVNGPPQITCPSNITVHAAPGQTSSNVTFNVTATDACGSQSGLQSRVSTPPSGFAFPVGATVVTNVATDVYSNTATCTFSVTVVQNQPPVAQCADVIVAAGTNCMADASVNNGSLDPDGDPITLSQSPPGPYPLGTNRVTLTVTDSHGASKACSALVIVQDQTPPVLTCPGGQVLEFQDQAGAVAAYSVTTTDLCSAVSVAVAPASGSVFPIGVTPVLAQATDRAGNRAQCGFTVTVLGAQGVKSNVLAELTALRAGLTLSPSFAQKFDDAIGHLSNSLAAVYWVDQTRLQPKLGNTAMNEEKLAASGLQGIMGLKGCPADPAVLQGFINRIVKCDRLLAMVSIQDAAAAGLNARKIAEDLAMVAKGDGEAAAQHYANGIEDYRNAWRHALQLRLQVGLNPDGSVLLQFVGNLSTSYLIQGSADLVNWVSVGACTADGDGNVQFTDRTAASQASRFYRAVEQ